MRRALLVLLALALSACEPAPTDIRLLQPSLVVKGVLMSGDTTATVVVMDMRDSRFQGYEGVGVAGAHVLLVTGADTVALVHDPAVPCRALPGPGPVDPGCYTGALPGAVRPGAEYRLVVNVPGRGPVHGSTVVPSLPVLHAPAGAWTVAASRSTSTERGEEIEAGWSGVSPDAWTELRVWRVGAPECRMLLGSNSDWWLALFVTGMNSARFAIHHPDCDRTATPDEVEALMGIWAYDANYSGYVAMRGREGLREDEVAWGIRGAAGVFGSAAAVHHPVRLRMLPAPAQ